MGGAFEFSPHMEEKLNPCSTVAVIPDPEPPFLTYLRERWTETLQIRPRPPGSGQDSSCEEEEEEVNHLLLDPTQWKNQDHYALLGLGKIRYKATAEEIKKSYRQKVLMHHPDKQSGERQNEGDDRFKCIKIAYDILSNPKKRRAYDSVDPMFDDSIPSVCTASKEKFFATFAPIFAENARWSTQQPVPALGDENSSISEVEAFYSFWYDFDSWREYSYQDEEDSEKGECREERRWIEKQNKAVRLKKKKEEVTRIRTLVDNAYSCDPRVKRFKEEEKAQKEAKKRARQEAAKKEAILRKEEERRKQEEEQLRREKAEQEAKALAAEAKKEKEAVKKVLRRERKNLRTLCKDQGYFARDETEVVSKMQGLDRLCTALSLEDLKLFYEKLSKCPSPEEARAAFEAKVAELNEQEQEKLKASLLQSTITSSASAENTPKSSSSNNWSPEEVQLLVKAVNLFPAGTVRRWETVASFINTHSTTSGSKEKDSKMVIAKVKHLQKLESEEKESLNKNAYARFEESHKLKDKVQEKGKGAGLPQATPSERYDGPRPWSAEEQKLLEQALRSYPVSIGPERWNRIAETVGSRTKEECVARFKELVAKVKAKKKSTAA